MPLRIRRRPDTGGLEITGTVRPAGAAQGVRIRRRAGSSDPALAREEAAALEAALLRAAWHGERPADHGWAEAVISYVRQQPRSLTTKALLRRLTKHWRDKPLRSIDQEALDRARDALLRPDAAPGTVRRNIIVPVSAVLRHAAKRGWCHPVCFDKPRDQRRRIVFLLPHQAEAVIAAAAPHLQPLLRFLVCTGCRMNEALRLEWSDVDLQGARVMLWEGETKSGNRRVVHLVPAAVAVLAALPWRDGRVFRPPHGRRGKRPGYRLSGETGCGGQIRRAWGTACRAAGFQGSVRTYRRGNRRLDTYDVFVPEITPHALRHTWASWHYVLYRDVLLLREAGGWANLWQVQRYAHVMPAGHEAEIRRVWGILERRTGRRVA